MHIIQQNEPKENTGCKLPDTVDVLIVGGGIAGLSSAHALIRRQPQLNILIIEKTKICASTTAAAGGGFRCWWPESESLGRLARYSIELIREEVALASDPHRFAFSDKGYVMLSADPHMVHAYLYKAVKASAHGAGPVRLNGKLWTPNPKDSSHQSVDMDDNRTVNQTNASEDGYTFDIDAYMQHVDGVDIINDPVLIQRILHRLQTRSDKHDVAAFNTRMTTKAAVMMHIRNAGHMDPVAFSQHILDRAKSYGNVQIAEQLELIEIEYESLPQSAQNTTDSICVKRVKLRHTQCESIHQVDTRIVVLAAGPFLRSLGMRLGVRLAVANESHARVIYEDPLGVGPQHGQSWTFWSDQVRLSDAHSHNISPAGVHVRSWDPIRIDTQDKSIQQFTGVWTFHREYQNEGSNRDLDPIFPPPIPKDYALHVLQGISHIFPGTNAYISTHTNSNISTQSQLLCKHQIVAGYYTKTQDNQPMIGPILRNEAGQNVQGLWVYGALSGHGIMISLGGAELLAKRLFASGQISTKQGMDHTQDNVAARRYILEDTIKDTWFQVNIGDFTDSINAITDQM